MGKVNLKSQAVLNTPQSLSAAIGEINGEIDLLWDPVEGACSYAIEVSRNGKRPNWQMVDIVSSSRYTVTGLKHRGTYCFRVSALDNKQQGPWSNVVLKRI